jgi:hypothetical protein
MEEVWKDIPGYEGKYQASNLGRIRSLDRPRFKGRVLKHDKRLSSKDRKRAYYTICFSVDGFTKYEYVHRCIAKTFVENPENKSEVNHINGDKLNNAVSNLEWINRKDNCKHSRSVLRKRGKSLTVDQVLEIIELYGKGMMMKDIAKLYKIRKLTVGEILNEKYWPSSEYPEIKAAREKNPYVRRYWTRKSLNQNKGTQIGSAPSLTTTPVPSIG